MNISYYKLDEGEYYYAINEESGIIVDIDFKVIQLARPVSSIMIEELTPITKDEFDAATHDTVLECKLELEKVL